MWPVETLHVQAYANILSSEAADAIAQAMQVHGEACMAAGRPSEEGDLIERDLMVYLGWSASEKGSSTLAELATKSRGLVAYAESFAPAGGPKADAMHLLHRHVRKCPVRWLLRCVPTEEQLQGADGALESSSLFLCDQRCGPHL